MTPDPRTQALLAFTLGCLVTLGGLVAWRMVEMVVAR